MLHVESAAAQLEYQADADTSSTPYTCYSGRRGDSSHEFVGGVHAELELHNLQLMVHEVADSSL